jgi:Tfp pilus assembly protein PilF
MKSGKVWATVLFADVAGFSLSMVRHGEDAVTELLACRSIFANNLAAHGGHLVDTAGDSILIWFDNPDNCLDFSIMVFRQIKFRSNKTGRSVDLEYRAGVASGPIFTKGQEIFGDAVIEAARICGMCSPGEVAVASADHSKLLRRFAQISWQKRSSFIKEHEGVYTAFSFNPTDIDSASKDNAASGPPSQGGTGVFISVLKPRQQEWQGVFHASSLLGAAISARLLAEKMNAHLDFSEDANGHGDRRIRSSNFDYLIRCSVSQQLSGWMLQALVVFMPTSMVVGTYTKQEVNEADLTPLCNLLAIACGDAITRHQGSELLAMTTAPKSAQRYVSGALLNLRSTRPDSIQLAIHQLRKALELQPENSRAMSTLGRAYSIAWRFDWDCGIVDPQKMSYELTHHAQSIDPDDFRCLSDFGFCALSVGETAMAVQAYGTASQRVESDPEIRADFAMALSVVGKKKEALTLLKESLKRDPIAPDNRLWSLADILFSNGQYEDAASILSRMSNPLQASRLQAACAVRLKRDPQKFVNEIMRAQPTFSVQRWASTHPPAAGTELEDFVDALLEAGLPA